MKPFLIGGIILLIIGSFYLLPLLKELISHKPYLPSILLYLFIALIFEGIGGGLIAGGITSSGKLANNANKVYEKQYNDEIKRRESLQNRLYELNDTKMAFSEALNKCLNFNGSVIRIPDEYFYSDAIEFFTDRISTGRADTLKEAIEQYELHLHRMKLEDAAYASAEYQRQSANNLSAIRRASAINTVANVANTINHWNN